MRRPPLAAAGLGLAVVGLALAPASSSFDLLGHSLGPLVRDVRVFNDFEDVAANDNLAPDPMFPGATGAPLAIWKAAAEWGSTLHGDGTGDPTQFDGLGSGELVSLCARSLFFARHRHSASCAGVAGCVGAACSSAGMDCLRMISDPVAACMAYDLDVPELTANASCAVQHSNRKERESRV